MLRSEVATRRLLWKTVFLKILQNLQVNACATASYLIKLQTWSLRCFWAKGIFHGRFLSTELNHGKSYRKRKRYATLSSALVQKTNIFYDSEGIATGIHFFKLPSLLSEIHRWCNLIKRQNNKDGFNIFSNTFFVTTILWKKILKRHFREGSCYQVLFPQKNYQVKPLH